MKSPDESKWATWIDWGLDDSGRNLSRLDLLPRFLEEVVALRAERGQLRDALAKLLAAVYDDEGGIVLLPRMADVIGVRTALGSKSEGT